MIAKILSVLFLFACISSSRAQELPGYTFIPWNQYIPSGVTHGMPVQGFVTAAPSAVVIGNPFAAIDTSLQDLEMVLLIPLDKPLFSNTKYIFHNNVLAGMVWSNPSHNADRLNQAARAEMLPGFVESSSEQRRFLMAGNLETHTLTTLQNGQLGLNAFLVTTPKVIFVAVFAPGQISTNELFGNF